jgi:hypothetical protein
MNILREYMYRLFAAWLTLITRFARYCRYCTSDKLVVNGAVYNIEKLAL